MANEPTPDELISAAIDMIAVGYPIDGTADEKAEWMALLQADFECRAPLALERLRKAFRED